MTAIICVCQKRHSAVHVVTDAAHYMPGQGIVALAHKTAAVPQWPGVVTSTGSTFNVTLFSAGLAQKFTSWDAMIAGAESELPGMVAGYGLSWSTVILAGISAARGPEAWMFQNDADLPPHISKSDADASPLYAAPFKFVKLPDVIMSPVAPPEMSIAADYEGIDVDADPELVVWSLKKLVAMQRTMPLPDGVGGIGGWAELTTVSADGVTQSILQRWPGDKIGGCLRHEPIDWDAWRTQNSKPRSDKAPLRVVR